MKLSIIITTFNRAIQIEQMLEDLSYQYSRLGESDQEEIELLLIDNNSHDNTKEIAYKYTESLTLPLKYHLEQKQGQAAAKNLGVKHASGELIAFLDDDLTLDEDWLIETYKIAALCKNKEIGVYGGRVIPLWQERFPQWLSTEPPYGVKQEVFAGHSYGDAEQFYPFSIAHGAIYDSNAPEHWMEKIIDKNSLLEAKYPSGRNCLIRREIFDNCGDFRTDLGVSAAQSVGLHDDIEFMNYLSTLKIPMVYVPQCIAFHPVAPEQMEKSFVRTWYYKSARSLYWMAHTDRMRRNPDSFFGISDKQKSLYPKSLSTFKISGIPAYLFLKVFYLFISCILVQLSFDPFKAFQAELELAKAFGEIDAAMLVSKHKKNIKFSFKERIGKKIAAETIS